jgi:hypothetical protein
MMSRSEDYKKATFGIHCSMALRIAIQAEVFGYKIGSGIIGEDASHDQWRPTP